MKRIIAISLLLIFVAGQVNLTWATHFCGSFRVKSNLTIGHTELDCGMAAMESCEAPNHEAGKPVYEKQSCCENDYFSSDTDNIFSKAQSDHSQNVVFVLVHTITLFDVTPESKHTQTFALHSPPLIQPDKCVLYRTFLI